MRNHTTLGKLALSALLSQVLLSGCLSYPASSGSNDYSLASGYAPILIPENPPLSEIIYSSSASAKLSTNEQIYQAPDNIEISPDGTYLAFSYGKDSARNRTSGIYHTAVYQIRTGMQVSALRGILPVFSKNGKYLFYTSDGSLHSLSLEENRILWSLEMKERSGYSLIVKLWHAVLSDELFVLRNKGKTGWVLQVLNAKTGVMDRTIQLPQSGNSFIHDISPDGRFALGSGSSSLFVIDLIGHQYMRVWKMPTAGIRASFIPGSDSVAVKGGGEKVTILNFHDSARTVYEGFDYFVAGENAAVLTSEGIILHKRNGESVNIASVPGKKGNQLLGDGTQFIIIEDTSAYRVQEDTITRLLRPHKPSSTLILSSPNERFIYMSEDGWIRIFRPGTLSTEAIAYAGEESIYLGSTGESAYFVSNETALSILDLEPPYEFIMIEIEKEVCAAVSAGDTLLTGHPDGTISILHKDGSPITTLKFGAHSNPVRYLRFDRFNPGSFFSSDGTSLKKWALNSSSLVSSIPLYNQKTLLGEYNATYAITQLDSTTILVGHHIIDINTKQVTERLQSDIISSSVVYGSKKLTAIDSTGSVLFYKDIHSDAQVIKRSTNKSKAVSINSGREWLTVTYEDGSIEVCRYDGSKNLSYAFFYNEFIVWNEDGYFDGTSGIDAYIHFTSGLTSYSLPQFALRFNRPDILWRNMQMFGNNVMESFKHLYTRRKEKKFMQKERIESTPSTAHIPECRIIDSFRSQDGGTLNVQFSSLFPDEQDGEYVAYLNGNLEFSGKAKHNSTITIETILISGRNVLEIEVVSQEGTASYKESVYAFKEAEKNDPAPELYIIGFANNRYSDYYDNLGNLQYAEKDAMDLMSAIEKRNANYYKVHAQLLLGTSANRENLIKAIEEVSTCRREDSVIIYMAGHGIYDKGEYFFLTGSGFQHDKSAQRINFTEIEGLIEGIPSRSKLLILDTCQSGEMLESDTYFSPKLLGRTIDYIPRGLILMKDESATVPDSSHQKSIDFMSLYSWKDIFQRSGIVVLSSSRGNESSYEPLLFDRNLNGLFIEALIQTLNSTKTETPGLRTVFEVVRKDVSNKTGGQQNPVIDRDNPYIDMLFY